MMSKQDGKESDLPDIEPVNLGLPMLKELGVLLVKWRIPSLSLTASFELESQVH